MSNYAVEFKNFHYAYNGGEVVLKDIKHKDFAVLDLIAKCQDLKN